MPELVLLSLSKAAVEDAQRRVFRGETTLDDVLCGLWDDYRGRELACFVCDAATANPPFAAVIPDPRKKGQMVAAPLCPACVALPKMVRLHRCLKMMRRMTTKAGRRL